MELFSAQETHQHDRSSAHNESHLFNGTASLFAENHAEAFALQRMANSAFPPVGSMQVPFSGTVIQRVKKEAQKLVDKEKFDIKNVDQKSVRLYVNDISKPIKMRRDLCRSWNHGQRFEVSRIEIPDDLVDSGIVMNTTTDFTDWDSEDEDGLDLDKQIEAKKIGTVTLVREKGELKNVRILEMSDIVKIGRQVVKRGEYEMYLPLVGKVGSKFFEYKDPGTLDIYATPLKSTETEGKYKRAGTSSEFNFKNLTSNLDEELNQKNKINAKKEKEKVKIKDEGAEEFNLKIEEFKNEFESILEEKDKKNIEFEKKELTSEEIKIEIENENNKERKDFDFCKEMLNNIFGTFFGETIGSISEAEAEAIAAISCDFMKGSKAIEFVREAKRENEKGGKSFAKMFTLENPIYKPAAGRGRKLVTELTNKRRLEKKKTEEKKSENITEEIKTEQIKITDTIDEVMNE